MQLCGSHQVCLRACASGPALAPCHFKDFHHVLQAGALVYAEHVVFQHGENVWLYKLPTEFKL